jgi:glycosyltransferase involved in cell wall biosynthesis
MYHNAAHVFTMGAPARESLIADYGVAAERITVAGGGLTLERMPEPGTPASEPVIVFVGRDFERKGGEVLLRAFAHVREQVPAARLELIGVERRPVPPGVTSHGKLSDREALAAFYRRARVFCMPSLYEPYGFVFGEAMAHGIPCVGTTVQSIPELLDHGAAGLLVPPGDAVALADALLRLLRDEQLARDLGARGREYVERTQSWDLVAARVADTLAKIA